MISKTVFNIARIFLGKFIVLNNLESQTTDGWIFIVGKNVYLADCVLWLTVRGPATLLCESSSHKFLSQVFADPHIDNSHSLSIRLPPPARWDNISIQNLRLCLLWFLARYLTAFLTTTATCNADYRYLSYVKKRFWRRFFYFERTISVGTC